MGSENDQRDLGAHDGPGKQPVEIDNNSPRQRPVPTGRRAGQEGVHSNQEEEQETESSENANQIAQAQRTKRGQDNQLHRE